MYCNDGSQVSILMSMLEVLGVKHNLFYRTRMYMGFLRKRILARFLLTDLYFTIDVRFIHTST